MSEPAQTVVLKGKEVHALGVGPGGDLRPIQRIRRDGKQFADIREVSGEFLLDLQRYWRDYGMDILIRTGERFPELIVAAQVKLAKVTRVEIGNAGEFSAVADKAEIAKKLEDRAGPEARKLFEKFTRDLAKLQQKANDTD